MTLAIILWKLWRYSRSGVWRRARAEAAVDYWRAYRDDEALEIAVSGRGVRARLATVAIRCADAGWSEDRAREETVRVAKGLLAEARAGLRPLELIATVAPLLGLLGTVLGMIAAFQQLQAAGTRADPSALAGGIWEALLTTAAGMAVAIPASAALTWFESVNERLRHDLEDIATRVFARPRPAAMRHAAE
jgi:biopolymer transport protein ExbB